MHTNDVYKSTDGWLAGDVLQTKGISGGGTGLQEAGAGPGVYGTILIRFQTFLPFMNFSETITMIFCFRKGYILC